jgi:hypothetical protein
MPDLPEDDFSGKLTRAQEPDGVLLRQILKTVRDMGARGVDEFQPGRPPIRASDVGESSMF